LDYTIGHVFLAMFHSTLLEFFKNRSLFSYQLEAGNSALIKSNLNFPTNVGRFKWLFLGIMFLLSKDVFLRKMGVYISVF
jgi:hypothetical protein